MAPSSQSWLVGSKSDLVPARAVFSCAVDLLGCRGGKDNKEAGSGAEMQRASLVLQTSWMEMFRERPGLCRRGVMKRSANEKDRKSVV